MKLLHSGDWHIRDSNIDDCRKCLQFLVDTAEKERVDLAIIAGDCFDSRDIKLDSLSAKLIIKTISELADICTIAVILGTPSHDGTAPEILTFAKGKFSITVAVKPMQVILDGAVLTLIPTPTKQFFQTESGISESNAEISQAMNGLFAGFGARAVEFDCPHILVGHWQVAGSIVSTGQTLTGHDIDIGFDQMMLANPDLICLGHIHMPQKLGDRAFYSGSLYPLTWGELEAKGFYIHALDGKKLVESRFIETPTRKLVRVQEDLVNEVECKDFDMELVKGAYVRADYTVYQDEVSKIDKDQVTKFYKDFGAIDVDIRIIRIPRETIRAASVLEAETLKDEFLEMAKLRGEDIDPETLSMAEQLETVPAEELLKTITEAA